MPHVARSFDALPAPDAAPSLLRELATRQRQFGPVPADRPLALYGLGNLGRLARNFLTAVHQNVAIAVDREAGRVALAPEWAGVRALHPCEVPADAKRNMKLLVSVVTTPFVPLENALVDSGFEDVVPFYDLAESFRHLLPLSNGWFAAPLTAQDTERTATVLAQWHDDVSRAHHLQFLAWRRLREEWTFNAAPVVNENRFFIPEIVRMLGADEVFIDAGAHHGSVTEAFVRHTGGQFRQIIAIEPDPGNHARLAQNLRERWPDDRRFTAYDCALADEEREASFHDGLDYVSQLSETGRLRVRCRRLDSLDLKPTFFKLHLEGAELAALRGAKRTLLESRPIVAATVYHNDDGIWKTASWLKETLPDYRLLFRAHSWCGTGAVIYGLPDERVC